ncbi:MAG: methyltransferase domain-containing protein [Nitrospirae bacterium]|nr:methyltransferase domain-containing protein [Nitrospirota bacterium]
MRSRELPNQAVRIRAIRNFDDFRDVIFTYRLPRILLTALDLDLFTVMGARSWTIPALAKRLRVSVRGMDILCRNLACAGLLNKQGAQYRAGNLARTALNARSPAYRGAYLDLLRGQWEDWSQLTTSVRRGRPVEHEAPDDPVYRRQFTWAMHHRSVEVAPKVAAQVHLRGARTLLDLGGGPGTYALAFLARNPALRATVCDRAPALEVAREIAGPLKYGRRLSYLPLDFVSRPIPGKYDVIWYSNVLHIYSPTQNKALFRKMAAALHPKGRLLIQDAFLLDRNGLYPMEANLFAVTMLLFTEEGNTYGAAETARWLRETGFERIRRITLRKGTEDWEGGLLEACLLPGPPARPRRSLAPRSGSAGN